MVLPHPAARGAFHFCKRMWSENQESIWAAQGNSPHGERAGPALPGQQTGTALPRWLSCSGFPEQCNSLVPQAGHAHSAALQPATGTHTSAFDPSTHFTKKPHFLKLWVAGWCKGNWVETPGLWGWAVTHSWCADLGNGLWPCQPGDVGSWEQGIEEARCSGGCWAEAV